MYKYLLIIQFAILSINTFAQKATLHGRVLDQDNYPIEMAAISVVETQTGTTTNAAGRFEIEVAAGIELTLDISCLGHQTVKKKITLKQGERSRLDIILKQVASMISEVQVTEERHRYAPIEYISPKTIKQLPSISGSAIEVVKSQPGVSSSNELSSQYSVRGGNYDENLIYVNGIEIYKPFLVRSGQQEGMNFINSDLISSISFSSGGFEPRFGDKMSSVLDIEYKRPTQFGVKVDLGTINSSATVEGTALGGRFSHITGVRYKQMKNVLGSLDAKGEYQPTFFDIQTLLAYDLTEFLEISFLGYLSDNNYKFIPTDRETTFGMINNALKFKVYFDGQEVDRFFTAQGAMSLKYHPSENNEWRISLSSFYSAERETFDIQGQYWLNQVDAQLGSSSLGDSISSLAVGTYLDHARNYLDAVVSTLSLTNKRRFGENVIQWGMSLHYYQIEDNVNEWMMLDSAGYSIPHHHFEDKTVDLYTTRRFAHKIDNMRTSGFIQDTWSFASDSINYYLTGGVRYHYSDFNKELLISPRLSFALKPNWYRDWLFRLSTGFYYQPPFYKEMIKPDGSLNSNIKSQKSTHAVLAADYNFRMWNRPFKMTVESYYKHLQNLVPYTVDNVRIVYDGVNHANGYSVGVDFKLTGEFVKGVDSWLSMSLMQIQENLTDDFYVISNTLDTVRPSFIPRPTDQRFMANLFFQDYWPGYPSIKFHMNAVFNTGLPFGPPNSQRYRATARMPAYTRIDMGISKEIIKKSESKKILNFIENLWIGLEVFNVFDIANTISYTWITDVYNQQYAIPNKLTGRLFNVKINAVF